MRIALVHALRHSPAPIEDSFARLWPEARLCNLLDDSLSTDLTAAGHITNTMTERFFALGRYVASTGADAVLFTCSAFGPCIDACAAALAPLPVMKPNEAMIQEAYAPGRRIGLLASFAPTLRSMPAEFPHDVTVVCKLADGALAALDRGDLEEHDRLAAFAAEELADCDVIVLAQFSLARAAQIVARRTGKPVLTTPDCAVRKLMRLLKR